MNKEEQWLLDEKYHGRKTAAYQKDVLRLRRGEPKDYVIGFVEFLGCKIDLSKRPLIPRFETEFWAEQAIEAMSEWQIANSKKGHSLLATGFSLRVLDIFSGSGAIGIAIAKKIPGAHVAFADSEENCIGQIAINCSLNKIPADRYEIIQSDVFENIAGTFDVIVANPPYIPLKNKHKVQESAINHEPHVSLFGKEDGLFYIKQFLIQARSCLAPAGKLYMEFDSHQKPAIAKLLKQYGYKAWKFKKDQYGRGRYVVVGN